MLWDKLISGSNSDLKDGAFHPWHLTIFALLALEESIGVPVTCVRPWNILFEAVIGVFFVFGILWSINNAIVTTRISAAVKCPGQKMFSSKPHPFFRSRRIWELSASAMNWAKLTRVHSSTITAPCFSGVYLYNSYGIDFCAHEMGIMSTWAVWYRSSYRIFGFTSVSSMTVLQMLDDTACTVLRACPCSFYLKQLSWAKELREM